MKLMLLVMITGSVFMSGCVVHPPTVEVEPPIKVITPDYNDNDDGGKGCPPGLRKQGRC